MLTVGHDHKTYHISTCSFQRDIILFQLLPGYLYQAHAMTRMA
jgi:hypothetical protein